MKALLHDFHRRIDTMTNHACSAQVQTALPLSPCGLCAIPAFQQMGISAVKIVGRESSALRKLASLKLVRAIVERARTGAPEEEIQAYAQDLRERVAPCIPGEMCYYTPEQPRSPSLRERARHDEDRCHRASTPSNAERLL